MKKKHGSERINKIETTPDTLTGRGGLALFSRYLEKAGILDIMEEKFGHLRKSSKGLPIWILFKQVFCFLFDGTSSHMTYFDALKGDPGYAAVIETDPSDMASSHAVKRFFALFGWWMSPIFRWILKRMFIWRLNIEKPDEIELYIDVMVIDNDDASKRHGVQPTYKKVKGFAPLHIIWNGMIVDALFRGGKKSGNHGDAVANMVTGLADLIRREYSENVTIIIRCDAGFFDEKNFDAFDTHNIAFIASGKMYKSVKEIAGESSEKYWGSYENGNQLWRYFEFGFRCETWKRFFRAFYTHCLCKGQQMLLDFERPDNVVLTNIGINEKVLENCSQERQEHWLDPETIIHSYHQCGTDELVHRG
ncbi:MAG: IS1380 family transposase, partial [Proteobacteria bacterium]|nr:IS1380 family transposase [Pseudomonadota bacterium]